MAAVLWGPATEAADRGRGMGHLTLCCGTCSDQDHRDTRFYQPPAGPRPGRGRGPACQLQCGGRLTKF